MQRVTPVFSTAFAALAALAALLAVPAAAGEAPEPCAQWGLRGIHLGMTVAGAREACPALRPVGASRSGAAKYECLEPGGNRGLSVFADAPGDGAHVVRIQMVWEEKTLGSAAIARALAEKFGPEFRSHESDNGYSAAWSDPSCRAGASLSAMYPSPKLRKKGIGALYFLEIVGPGFAPPSPDDAQREAAKKLVE